MKPSAVLLAASLAANVGLCAWYLLRPETAGLASAAATAAPSAARSSPVTPHGHVPATLGRDYATLSPEQLHERLRGSGLPDIVIRQIVGARISETFRARRTELMNEALKSVPPWRLAMLRTDRLSILTPAQRQELRDLEAAVRDETLRLLGPGQLDREGTTAFRYGFVSPEKAVLLDALVRDYETMGAQAKEDSRYLKTPGDLERDKFLRAEQDRDLAALLTPAEREAFELRASPTALNGNFQRRIAAFQPTEAEYRALFALQKASDDRTAAGIRPEPGLVARPPAGVTGATMISISGNTQIGEDEARAALGDPRFAEWQLAGTSHFQELRRLAAPNKIAPETVKSVAALLTETTNASWRISDDASLTVDQKKAALANLATATRAQVTTSLGADVADSYLKSTQWFEGLNTGTAVQINGNATYYRSVDRTTPQPRPTPANPAAPRG